MKNAPLPTFLFISVLCAVCAATGSAANTPAPEISQTSTNEVGAADMQRAFGLLQNQIRALQLAIERSQQDAQAAIQHTTEDMAARFQVLETSLKSQRADELEAMQRANHLTLLMAGSFLAVMFITLLFTAYFQWRVANRLAELSSVRPTLLTLASSRTLSDRGQIASGDAVGQANTRLAGVVEQLQRRILELEQLARPPVKDKVTRTATPAGKV